MGEDSDPAGRLARTILRLAAAGHTPREVAAALRMPADGLRAGFRRELEAGARVAHRRTRRVLRRLAAAGNTPTGVLAAAPAEPDADALLADVGLPADPLAVACGLDLARVVATLGPDALMLPPDAVAAFAGRLLGREVHPAEVAALLAADGDG
jgi:hypothetical protein